MKTVFIIWKILHIFPFKGRGVLWYCIYTSCKWGVIINIINYTMYAGYTCSCLWCLHIRVYMCGAHGGCGHTQAYRTGKQLHIWVVVIRHRLQIVLIVWILMNRKDIELVMWRLSYDQFRVLKGYIRQLLRSVNSLSN